MRRGSAYRPTFAFPHQLLVIPLVMGGIELISCRVDCATHRYLQIKEVRYSMSGY